MIDLQLIAPTGLTCFLDVIFVYALKVTVMTVTRYDFISIKDLHAARKKLNLKNIFSISFLSTSFQLRNFPQ
jgi:hypothetical protein